MAFVSASTVHRRGNFGGLALDWLYLADPFLVQYQQVASGSSGPPSRIKASVKAWHQSFLRWEKVVRSHKYWSAKPRSDNMPKHKCRDTQTACLPALSGILCLIEELKATSLRQPVEWGGRLCLSQRWKMNLCLMTFTDSHNSIRTQSAAAIRRSLWVRERVCGS